MSKSKSLLLFASVTILTAVVFLISYCGICAGQEIKKIDCTVCHTCQVPTQMEPCLKACPRTQMVHQSSKHELGEAPDSMLLDEIRDQYQGVHFNHKRHAGMAEMGGDCVTCHHYSPPGIIPACKQCHAKESETGNLRQPNLKGAYHRQCLSCHREWSHDTKCVLCHIPSPGGKFASETQDTTDIIGISHPVITPPMKRVYDTPYKQGPVVTFQHKEHIDLFGFRCVDCHRQESCGNCHDITKPAVEKKTQEQVHAVCNNCHKDAECSKCHDTKERPGFTHNQTGWPLNRFHNRLDCWSCHPTGKKISKLGKMCVNCHQGWNQENFKHAVTGLLLDEVHSQIDCKDCHKDGKYNNNPACDNCHDDGRTADKQPPGMKTKRATP